MDGRVRRPSQAGEHGCWGAFSSVQEGSPTSYAAFAARASPPLVLSLQCSPCSWQVGIKTQGWEGETQPRACSSLCPAFPHGHTDSMRCVPPPQTLQALLWLSARGSPQISGEGATPSRPGTHCRWRQVMSGKPVAREPAGERHKAST